MATRSIYRLEFDEYPTTQHLIEELETALPLFDECRVEVIDSDPGLILELKYVD